MPYQARLLFEHTSDLTFHRSLPSLTCLTGRSFHPNCQFGCWLKPVFDRMTSLAVPATGCLGACHVRPTKPASGLPGWSLYRYSLGWKVGQSYPKGSQTATVMDIQNAHASPSQQPQQYHASRCRATRRQMFFCCGCACHKHSQETWEPGVALQSCVLSAADRQATKLSLCSETEEVCILREVAYKSRSAWLWGIQTTLFKYIWTEGECFTGWKVLYFIQV